MKCSAVALRAVVQLTQRARAPTEMTLNLTHNHRPIIGLNATHIRLLHICVHEMGLTHSQNCYSLASLKTKNLLVELAMLLQTPWLDLRHSISEKAKGNGNVGRKEKMKGDERRR